MEKKHRAYLKKIQKYLKVIKKLNADKEGLETQMAEKLAQQKTIVIEKNYSSEQEYEGKIYGLLRYTLLQVEHSLVITRVR